MVQVTGSVEEGHQICLVGCGKVQKKELVKLTFFVLFAVSCSFPLLERLGVAEQVAPVPMDDAADGDDHSDSAAVGRTADDGHQMCWYLANENAAAVASRYIPYYSWAEDLSVVDPYCGCFCLNDGRLLLSCCAITGCWYHNIACIGCHHHHHGHGPLQFFPKKSLDCEAKVAWGW